MSGAPLPEADVDRVAVHAADERDIRPVREARVALGRSSHSQPVEIEIFNRKNALRISHIEQHSIPPLYGRLAFHNPRRAHVHFKLEMLSLARKQAEMLDARAGTNTEFFAGDVPARQQRGSASRAITRDFRLAAIGVEQADRRIETVARR